MQAKRLKCADRLSLTQEATTTKNLRPGHCYRATAAVAAAAAIVAAARSGDNPTERLSKTTTGRHLDFNHGLPLMNGTFLGLAQEAVGSGQLVPLQLSRFGGSDDGSGDSG